VRDMAYGNGHWVSVGDGERSAAFSTNGINFQSATTAPTGFYRAVAYGNGFFVAVGDSIAMRSPTGQTWTSVPPFAGAWCAITHNTEDRFVAVASSGTWRVQASP
jgi:hypothetical protein